MDNNIFKHLIKTALTIGFLTSTLFGHAQAQTFQDTANAFNISILKSANKGITIKFNGDNVLCSVSPVLDDPTNPIADKFTTMEKNYTNIAKCLIGKANNEDLLENQKRLMKEFNMSKAEASSMLSGSIKPLLNADDDVQIKTSIAAITYSLMAYRFTNDPGFSDWSKIYIEQNPQISNIAKSIYTQQSLGYKNPNDHVMNLHYVFNATHNLLKERNAWRSFAVTEVLDGPK